MPSRCFARFLPVQLARKPPLTALRRRFLALHRPMRRRRDRQPLGGAEFEKANAALRLADTGNAMRTGASCESNRHALVTKMRRPTTDPRAGTPAQIDGPWHDRQLIDIHRTSVGPSADWSETGHSGTSSRARSVRSRLEDHTSSLKPHDLPRLAALGRKALRSTALTRIDGGTPHPIPSDGR